MSLNDCKARDLTSIWFVEVELDGVAIDRFWQVGDVGLLAFGVRYNENNKESVCKGSRTCRGRSVSVRTILMQTYAF